jgi:sulfhydrogenase subunit alpha
MRINVDYIARVEGEGSVNIEIKGGKLKNLKLNIWEPPRFFEGFLVGRRLDEVPDIVSRICGICPVSHMTTSIHALEKALGVIPSLEIKNIRTIMALSQIIASHLVHLYMLVLPDYYKLDMLSGHENEIKRLLRLKEAVVGGFTKVPSRDEIGKMIKQLEAIKDDTLDTVKMISELQYPDFKNDPEYVAIVCEDEYAVNEGSIVSSSGLKTEVDDYHAYFKEAEVPYSNAKRTVLKGKDSIMVGALSRLHIKFDMLHPEAKKVAEMIGFKTLEKNPFYNNWTKTISLSLYPYCKLDIFYNSLSMAVGL